MDNTTIMITINEILRTNNIPKFLDFMDDVDYNVLDFTDIKTIYILIQYIRYKIRISELTFSRLLDHIQMKRKNIYVRFIYDYIVSSIHKIYNVTYLTDDNTFDYVKDIDDISIKYLGQFVLFDPVYLYRYGEKEQIMSFYKEIKDLKLDDFNIINEIKYALEHNYIGNTTNNIEIVEDIRELEKLGMKNRPDQILRQIEIFKTKYGPNRSKLFLDIIYWRIDYDNDRNPDKLKHRPILIDNLVEYFPQLSIYLKLYSLLKVTTGYRKDIFNTIIDIVNRDIKLLNGKYREAIEHNIKIFTSTYEINSNKVNIHDRRIIDYIEYLDQLIIKNRKFINLQLFSDYLSIKSKILIINKEYEKLYEFYVKYQEYIKYAIKNFFSIRFIAIFGYDLIVILLSINKIKDIIVLMDYIRSCEIKSTDFIDEQAKLIYNKLISRMDDIDKLINAIEKYGFILSENRDTENECVICSNEIKIDTTEVKCTKCNKCIGHIECTVNWFKNSKSCPLCRFSV